MMSFRRSIIKGLIESYDHAEAFHLMTYQSEDGETTEIIWNSRDGVTPFFIAGKDGVTEMKHVDWYKDVFDPHYIPKPGERVFMTISKEDYLVHIKEQVETMWDGEGVKMKDHFESKDQAIEILGQQWQEGMPCIRTVAKEGWPNIEPEVGD
jgi:hypothetical protein